MLAEVALAAFLLFPWSLVVVPVALKVLSRWTCTFCMGTRRVQLVDEQGVPDHTRCPMCRGWGYTKRRAA